MGTSESKSQKVQAQVCEPLVELQVPNLNDKLASDLKEATSPEDVVGSTLRFMGDTQEPSLEVIRQMKIEIKKLPEALHAGLYACVADLYELLQQTMGHCMKMKQMTCNQLDAANRLQDCRELALQVGFPEILEDEAFTTGVKEAMDLVSSALDQHESLHSEGQLLICKYRQMQMKLDAQAEILQATGVTWKRMKNLLYVGAAIGAGVTIGLVILGICCSCGVGALPAIFGATVAEEAGGGAAAAAAAAGAASCSKLSGVCQAMAGKLETLSEGSGQARACLEALSSRSETWHNQGTRLQRNIKIRPPLLKLIMKEHVKEGLNDYIGSAKRLIEVIDKLEETTHKNFMTLAFDHQDLVSKGLKSMKPKETQGPASMPIKAVSFAGRVLDMNPGALRLTKIEGVMNETVTSLEESIKPLVHLGIPNLEMDVAMALFFADTKVQEHLKGHDDIDLGNMVDENGLTIDEAAAVHLYTRPSLYKSLNAALRSESPENAWPYFRYLRLLLSGLSKLPAVEATVARALPVDMSEQLTVGKKDFWWSLSSATWDTPTIDQFMGCSGKRSLLSISQKSGRNISSYSTYREEQEVLLCPGFQYRVNDVQPKDDDADVMVYHLEEMEVVATFFSGC